MSAVDRSATPLGKALSQYILCLARLIGSQPHGKQLFQQVKVYNINQISINL
jgi:hypothetical protein